ncbi:MAG: metalloregulator ArsR/SmtB family transcription factor [Acidobacteriaceae bacterium]
MRRSPQPSDMVHLFAALADRTRLRLLSLMEDREVCVCYFVEILRQSQPKISRHLAYLRGAGIVRARRDGKWMHYRIERPADPIAASVLDTALAALRSDSQMQEDRTRLKQACCLPQRFGALEGAPRPGKILCTTAAQQPDDESKDAYMSIKQSSRHR